MNEMIQVDATSISLNRSGSRGKKIGAKRRSERLLTPNKFRDE